MKEVKLFHKGIWYYAYNDDAKILAFLMDYKLYEHPKFGVLTVGFPEYMIDHVVDVLASKRINYILPRDENKLHDYHENNRYDLFIHDDLPISYVRDNQMPPKKLNGSFCVQYDREPEEKFVIGQNIDPEAELVKMVEKHDVGDQFKIGEFEVKLLEKEVHY